MTSQMNQQIEKGQQNNFLAKKLHGVLFSRAIRVLGSDPTIYFISYSQARQLGQVHFHLRRKECRRAWQEIRAAHCGLHFARKGLLLTPPEVQT